MAGSVDDIDIASHKMKEDSYGHCEVKELKSNKIA